MEKYRKEDAKCREMVEDVERFGVSDRCLLSEGVRCFDPYFGCHFLCYERPAETIPFVMNEIICSV